MNVHNIVTTKNGFTLVECIVATALLSFLVLLVSSFSAQFYSVFLMSNRKMNITIVNNIALDRVARDIFSASTSPGSWDIKNGIFTKEMIDRKGKDATTCVGWALCTDEKYPGALVRWEGEYDFAKHTWKKKTMSIVEGFFLQFSTNVVMQNNNIFAVKIDYTDQYKRQNVVVIELASMIVMLSAGHSHVAA